MELYSGRVGPVIQWVGEGMLAVPWRWGRLFSFPKLQKKSTLKGACGVHPAGPPLRHRRFVLPVAGGPGSTLPRLVV